VDIPLQHISDNVLKSMRRGVTGQRTRELLFKLRNKIPDITLRTTFITGYPNETGKEFEELCEFVREIRFDRIGVFTFSMEENTSSFILGDPVSEKIKRRRKDILMEIQKEISTERNKDFIGKQLKVLIERIEGKFFVARSFRDAPEVDGEVLIPFNGYDVEGGNFYDVEITGANEYDLFAKLINN
jgi:ribosomal protein S12 methylthiotransferase